MRRATGFLLVLLAAAAASAVSDGELDAFSVNTEQWARGGLALGGPAGPSDPFLLLTADGGGSTGRLVTFNQAQWSGDYPGASVGQIAVWLNNLGPTDLRIRLAFGDNSAPLGGGTWYVSAVGELLPSGSGWTPVVFDIGSADLQLVQGTASYSNLMQNAVTLRILHAASPSAIGDPVVATLGVDRIVALPEPAAIELGGAALLALAACSRTRRARRAKR